MDLPWKFSVAISHLQPAEFEPFAEACFKAGCVLSASLPDVSSRPRYEP